MRRKTKIIATLGPAVASQQGIDELVAAGIDVARLNFSHGDHESHARMADWVRSASIRLERPVALLQDVQGPRIRVGTFPGGSAMLEDGEEVTLLPGEAEGTPGRIYIENLAAAAMAIGAAVLMSDGLIQLEAVAVSGSDVTARVIEGGLLHDHKGVAFPGTTLTVPAVTDKDERDLTFGQELEPDYVAASFVSSGSTIEAVRKHVQPGTPIIAKIESAVGYRNLDDILESADGAMVARGDLGVELSYESVPRAQKEILLRTNAKARISITATEMLESMTSSRRPTRAEVTDVSSAVLDGTDAVMLSAETAIGAHPAHTVATMARICTEAEAMPGYAIGSTIEFLEDSARFASATARACVEAAANLGMKAIVAFTESGSTARLISKYRPRADIYAFTVSDETFRRMALYSGVTPLKFERVESTDDMIAHAEQHLLDNGIAQRGEAVVMVAGIPPNQASFTNLMKLHSIGSASHGLPGVE
jgi:pyruvate kinase